MNNPKEAINLARRLLTDGKTLSATRVLVEHNLMEAPKIGIALSRLEQEYGILDEVLTESESARYFRNRCKIHEMRDEELTAEDYGCVDLGDPHQVYRMVLGGLVLALTVLAGGIIGLFLRLMV